MSIPARFLKDLLPAGQPKTLPPDMLDACQNFALGIYCGNALSTPEGIRPIETLRPGDWVNTFDHGAQRITSIHRHAAGDLPCPLPEPLWPIHIPSGLLGNPTPVLAAPDQIILVESDTAEEQLGDPFVLLPARTLRHLPFTEVRRPQTQERIYHLTFAQPELVITRTGAILLCDTGTILPQSWDSAEAAQDGRVFYNALPYEDAVALMEQDIAREGGIEGFLRKVISQMRSHLDA